VNRYAHEYEEYFAEILDTFGVEYEYEPTMFVIHQNGNGDIKIGFTPDFFIPELNLYVEITSMHGNSCNKKNRKIFKLKEIYDIDAVLLKKPKINKIFWKFRKGYLTKETLFDILQFNAQTANQA
jgi:hypothetical protein